MTVDCYSSAMVKDGWFFLGEGHQFTREKRDSFSSIVRIPTDGMTINHSWRNIGG